MIVPTIDDDKDGRDGDDDDEDDGLARVECFVARRAWGDVMHLTAEYLNDPSRPYQTFYSQMLLSTRVDVERERGDDEDDDRDARQHRLEPLLPSYPPCKLSRRGRS